MKDRQLDLKLPALLMAGSFLVILLLAILTSPIDKVSYAVFFFAALLTFLVSLGYLIVGLQTGNVTAKNRSRIIICSLFLVIFLMFRSAQSLGLVDALVLLAITIGLLFYSSRRRS